MASGNSLLANTCPPLSGCATSLKLPAARAMNHHHSFSIALNHHMCLLNMVSTHDPGRCDTPNLVQAYMQLTPPATNISSSARWTSPNALPTGYKGETSKPLTSTSIDIVSSPATINLYFLCPRQWRCLALGSGGQLIQLEMDKPTLTLIWLTTSFTRLTPKADSLEPTTWSLKVISESQTHLSSMREQIPNTTTP